MTPWIAAALAALVALPVAAQEAPKGRFDYGFAGLRERLGGLPLTFHSRHFSARSPYFEDHAAWRDAEYAHPSDTRLLDLLLEQVTAFGAPLSVAAANTFGEPVDGGRVTFTPPGSG